MSGLQAIGALADGISQGLVLSRQLKGMDMDLAERKRQADEAAAMQADMKAANEAAMAEANRMREQHAQQYRGLGASMLRGGSDGSLAGGDVAQDSVSQPVPDFKPSPRQMLQASEARTNELLRRGRVNEAMKFWVQDEGMRQQLRQQAASTGMQQFKATGDPTTLLKGIYENVDDGWDMTNVIRGPETQGGDTIFGVERVNRTTGEKQVHELRSSEIEGIVQQALDPKSAAELSWRSKLEALKGAETRKTNDLKHGLTMKEIAARGSNALDLQDAKTEGAIDLQGVKNEGMLAGKRIQVQGTVTAAQIRATAAGGGAGGGAAGGRVQKTLTLDDGRVMVVMRDGTNRILTGDDNKPVRGIDAEKLLAKVTSDIGKGMEGAMRPYAENRGAASAVLPKPPAAPAKPSLSSFDRVTPEQQAGRDSERLRILEQERAKATSPADIAALDREIAAVKKTLPRGAATRPGLDSYLR